MRLYDIIGMEVTNTPRGGENMEENDVEVLREDEKVWEVPDLSKVAYNFNEALSRFRETFEKTALAVGDMLKALTPLVKGMTGTIKEYIDLILVEESLRKRALSIGVSPKVVRLSRSKRYRTHKKNINRIRKEIRKWEKI